MFSQEMIPIWGSEHTNHFGLIILQCLCIETFYPIKKKFIIWSKTKKKPKRGNVIVKVHSEYYLFYVFIIKILLVWKPVFHFCYKTGCVTTWVLNSKNVG